MFSRIRSIKWSNIYFEIDTYVGGVLIITNMVVGDCCVSAVLKQSVYLSQRGKLEQYILQRNLLME